MKFKFFKPFWGLAIFVLVVGLACNAGNATVAPTSGAQVEQPTSVVEKSAMEPTATVEVILEVDYCVDCHTDKDQLISTGKPVVEAEAESSGVG